MFFSLSLFISFKKKNKKFNLIRDCVATCAKFQMKNISSWREIDSNARPFGQTRPHIMRDGFSVLYYFKTCNLFFLSRESFK